MKDEFREFIRTEIKRRDMSIRQFALFTDVSQPTLSAILDESRKEPYPRPTLDVLIKIARATKTDLGTLAAMFAPDTAKVSPEAVILAERIERLPPERRRIIDALILGYAFDAIDVPDE